MTAKTCFFCPSPAVYYDRRAGQGYCANHLTQLLEKKVRQELRRQGVNERERILIAVSGGKDSLVMMDLLWRVERRFKEVKLMAVTVDEGINGGAYRRARISLTKAMVEERGIQHELISFGQVFGFTLDEALRSLGKSEEPCTVCGVLRRRVLNDYAMRVGATKIAVAHNLDDEAGTFLMNVLRGDVRRGPAPLEDGLALGSFVPRIKPVRSLTERETAFYANMLGIPMEEQECPYYRSSFRDEIMPYLEELEGRHPGTMNAVVSAGEQLRADSPKSKPAGRCSICGYPTARGRDVCRVCELRTRVLSGLELNERSAHF